MIYHSFSEYDLRKIEFHSCINCYPYIHTLCFQINLKSTMSEKFNLTWNDFQTNLTNSFSKLRHDTDLSDVTLIADDQEQVQAHRVVLSSCSAFFQNIFKKNKEQKNLSLFLSDIQTVDLRNVLDYIYNGQVKIFQEDLERFLLIAQKFQLDGLLGFTNNDSAKNESIERVDEPKIASMSSPMEQNISRGKMENEPSIINHNTTSSLVSSAAGTVDIQALNEKIKELTEEIGDRCKCKICGHERSGRNRRQDLGNHIETHLEGLSFECQTCGKCFRSRHYLRCHVSSLHRRSNF